MAASVTVTTTALPVGVFGHRKCFKTTIDWVAAADGSVTDTVLHDLNGQIVKAITVPSTPAPTDNYDVSLVDPIGSVDALAGALQNRDTATAEQVYPVATGATDPIFVSGDYTLHISGNSQNGAKGQIVLFVLTLE